MNESELIDNITAHQPSGNRQDQEQDSENNDCAWSHQ